MFGSPVWILIVMPCLWGFCKVPVPSTCIGRRNVCTLFRLKSWYPTGYK